jgi:hypothetical protein
MNANLFSELQISQLRAHYGAITGVDPTSETGLALLEYVNNLPLPVLEQLAAAQIPWLSILARRRCGRK